METGGDNIVMYISVRQHDGCCELSILDNGPGITGITLMDVFKPEFLPNRIIIAVAMVYLLLLMR